MCKRKTRNIMETLPNIIVVFFVLATNPTTGEIGDSCISRCSTIYTESCVDGFCQCTDSSDTSILTSILTYKEGSLEPHCALVVDGCDQVTWRDSCEDKPNTHCKNNVCACEEGFYRIGKTCKKEVTLVSGPLERCGRTSDRPDYYLLCDIEKQLMCKSDLCICYDKYVPNLDKKMCEPEADYLKRNNLTEYRVLPGEYCKETKNCVEGLVCKDFKCACPLECNFIQRDNYYFCDCGEADREIAGPCITGIILGLIIILCWRCKIKNTIKKYKKLPESQGQEEPQAFPAPSYELSPSYGLQPTVPGAVANIGADPSRLTTDAAPVIGASANNHQLPEPENNFMLPPENNGKMSGSPQYPFNPAMSAMPYPINSVQPEAFSINAPPPAYNSLGFSQPAANTPYPHTYIPPSTKSSTLDSAAQSQPSGGGFKLPSASEPSYPLNPSSGPTAPGLSYPLKPASGPTAPPLVNLDSLTSSANSAPAYPLGPAGPLYPPNPSAPAYPSSPSNLPPAVDALQPPYNPAVKEG